MAVICDDCGSDAFQPHVCQTLFGSVHICEDCWPYSRYNPDYDPTPYCGVCKSMTKAGCGCPPRAENE